MLKGMETISQQMLNSDLDEILNRVSGEGTPTLVLRDDHPVAVIFPYEIYQQWVAAREQRLRQARQNLQTWVSEHAEVLTGLDSVELIREARSRYWRN